MVKLKLTHAETLSLVNVLKYGKKNELIPIHNEETDEIIKKAFISLKEYNARNKKINGLII